MRLPDYLRSAGILSEYRERVIADHEISGLDMERMEDCE